MGKKVLTIWASPRKGGNSGYLCDQFMHGAKDGGHEVEEIFLRDAGHILGKGVYAAGEIVANPAMEEAYKTGNNI